MGSVDYLTSKSSFTQTNPGSEKGNPIAKFLPPERVSALDLNPASYQGATCAAQSPPGVPPCDTPAEAAYEYVVSLNKASASLPLKNTH
jgi:hypothetical protein